MKVYEMRLKVYLLETMTFNQSLYHISKLIDSVLSQDKSYLEFHKENGFKYYNFSSFYPLEMDKIYKAGNVYSIQIRTVDEKLKGYLEENLKNGCTDSMKALTLSVKPIHKKMISEIYSVTPCVVKFDGGYWQGKESYDTLIERVKINMIKKYNKFFDVKIDEDFEFITYSKKKNNKPISSAYKNINILGDKLLIQFDHNERAQELAYFSLGTGIGDMSSRGFGFVNFRVF